MPFYGILSSHWWIPIVVVIVNPPGTGSPSSVISASPTPFPPSSSRPPGEGSSKSKTKRLFDTG